MNIREILIENQIEFQDLGDSVATYCPFCEKSYSGRSTATLNIDSITGSGSCFACKENFKWEEIIEKLGINIPIKSEVKETRKRSSKNSQEEETKEFTKSLEKVEPIDISKFKPLSIKELVEILSFTIKHDDENKLVTFFGMLSTYAGDEQFNISYNAPSSTGKSFIPLELSKLFPKEDLLKLGGCSPKAFFHEQGEFNQEKNERLVDLSSKILIFLDMPHNQLLAGLRPIFSHDQKEIPFKIADANQKGGTRTKTIILRGFPSVIFCTAGLKINDQEATRFLLLSPSMEQEKIKEGVSMALEKATDINAYEDSIKENANRNLLIERIRAIKNEKITNIKLSSKELVRERFLKDKEFMQPRAQRDIKRITSIIKAIAMLNLWWRDKNGSTIIANEQDINDAFDLWDKLCPSQTLNLPPYVLRLYELVIKPLWYKKEETGEDLGISRKEISKQHLAIYHQFLDNGQFSNSILPMLEDSGLIIQERDPNQKQRMLFYPVVENTNTNSAEKAMEDFNSF